MRRRRQELVTRLQRALEIGDDVVLRGRCPAQQVDLEPRLEADHQLAFRERPHEEVVGARVDAGDRRGLSRLAGEEDQRHADRRAIGAQLLRERHAVEAGHVGRREHQIERHRAERVARDVRGSGGRHPPSRSEERLQGGARLRIFFDDEYPRLDLCARHVDNVDPRHANCNLRRCRGRTHSSRQGSRRVASVRPVVNLNRWEGAGSLLAYLAAVTAVLSVDVAATPAPAPIIPLDPTIESPDVRRPYLHTALETALVIAGGTVWYLRRGSDERWGRAMEWQNWRRRMFTTEEITFDADHFNTNAAGHPLDGTVFYRSLAGTASGPVERSSGRSSRRRSGSTSSRFPKIRPSTT